MLITRSSIIWFAIIAIGMLSIILGIVAIARPILLETEQSISLLNDSKYLEQLDPKIVEHLRIIVGMGFGAILFGIGAIIVPTICLCRIIDPFYSKLSWISGLIVIISIILGTVALVFNAQLNDIDWLDDLNQTVKII